MIHLTNVLVFLNSVFFPCTIYRIISERSGFDATFENINKGKEGNAETESTKKNINYRVEVTRFYSCCLFLKNSFFELFSLFFVNRLRFC